MKGSVETPDEIIERVKKVTAKDIQKLAREIFVDKGLNMALIGRFKDGETFKKYFTLS